MTDREEAGLRDRVRTCSAERDSVSPDCHWVSHTTDTFSPQGHLLERRHRNPDGSRWDIVCRYDEQGQIIEREETGDLPEAARLFSYRYDALGRLERVILQSAREDERVFESVQHAAEWDEDKNVLPRLD